MAKTKQQLIDVIDNHIKNRGGSYSHWYVGIAANPRQRLFSDHNVDEKNGKWVYDEATSSTVAREVESHLIAKGTKGGGGGGDSSSRYVYAYRITSSTQE